MILRIAEAERISLSAAAAARMRAREAAHTAGLAREGRVRRLWRPPLKPGEWRSIGLFDAADPGALELVLASMPLRVWRTDEVTPLGAFPGDPGHGRVPIAAGDRDFLVWFEEAGPPPGGELLAREAERARELAAGGTLVRLWSTPGGDVGLWQAPGERELREVLAALPLAGVLRTEVVPLTRHPSDPGTG